MSVAVGELGLTYDYFYSLSLQEYYVIVEGARRRDSDQIKNIRWAVWQIVRHNPFLKNPPANPQKLMKMADEVEIDEETTQKAAQKLKEAIQKKNGKS